MMVCLCDILHRVGLPVRTDLSRQCPYLPSRGWGWVHFAKQGQARTQRARARRMHWLKGSGVELEPKEPSNIYHVPSLSLSLSLSLSPIFPLKRCTIWSPAQWL